MGFGLGDIKKNFTAKNLVKAGTAGFGLPFNLGMTAPGGAALGLGGGKSGPGNLDLNSLLDKQSGVNRQALIDSLTANRYDTEDQFGSTTWEGDGLGGWKRTSSLTPELQRQLDTANSGISKGLDKVGSMGGYNFSGLPSVGQNTRTSTLGGKDYSADASHVEKATFDRAMGLMRPEFELGEKRLDTKLSNRGIPISSEAYSTEMDRFNKGVNEATNNAALDSVLAGRNEQSRLFGIDSTNRSQDLSEDAQRFGQNYTARNQGINEQSMGMDADYRQLATMMNARSGLPSPGIDATSQHQMNPVDVVNPFVQQHTAATNAAAQKDAAKKSGTSNLASTGAMAAAMMSDIRLKKNIEPKGRVNGHNFYTWDWNEKAKDFGLSGSDFGVLADEVEEYAPNLIGEKDGYKTVDMGGIYQ